MLYIIFVRSCPNKQKSKGKRLNNECFLYKLIRNETQEMKIDGEEIASAIQLASFKKTENAWSQKTISFVFNARKNAKKFRRGAHRSNPPEVFLEKGVLKKCCKFTGEHPYRSVISIKL